jgi:hypothetical protein
MKRRNMTTRAEWTGDSLGNVIRFDSLDAAMTYAATDGDFHTDPTRTSPPASRRQAEGDPWSGSENMPDAIEIAAGRGGWSIHDQVDEMLTTVEPVLALMDGHRIRRQWDVAGGSVNVARALSGHPQAMRRARVVPAPRMGRVVTVLVNGTTNARVSPDTMRANGTIVYAFIEALRRAGIACNVYAISSTRTNKDTVTIVQVADSQAAPDRESLMFALGHPSHLRRLVFGLMEHLPAQQRKAAHVGGGYGSCHSTPQWVLDDIQPDIHIAAELSDDIPNPAAWITNKLRQCGVIE